MKINNKKELKRIAEEKSGHLDYKDFLKMYNNLLLRYHLKKTLMN